MAAATTAAKAAASKNIIQLITEIKAEVGALEKTQGGGGVPFPFRGVDSTVNHVADALIRHGVVTVPEVEEHLVSSREVGNNRIVKTTEVVVKFHFYAPDMSFVTAKTAGLADDFADRSTAQAQSVAYRIALLQTFTLPTQTPEPEVSGQGVIDTMAKEGNRPSKTEATIAKAGAKAVTKAAAADPKLAEVEELRLAVKKVAGEKSLSNQDLNAMGVEIDPDFFSNPASLKKLAEAIEAIEK